MSLQLLVVNWNTKFRHDRHYRRKFNITFNSPQHRSLTQIDQLFQLLEDKIFDIELPRLVKELEEKERDYNKGILFSETSSEITDADFDKIQI